MSQEGKQLGRLAIEALAQAPLAQLNMRREIPPGKGFQLQTVSFVQRCGHHAYSVDRYPHDAAILGCDHDVGTITTRIAAEDPTVLQDHIGHALLGWCGGSRWGVHRQWQSNQQQPNEIASRGKRAPSTIEGRFHDVTYSLPDRSGRQTWDITDPG